MPAGERDTVCDFDLFAWCELVDASFATPTVGGAFIDAETAGVVVHVAVPFASCFTFGKMVIVSIRQDATEFFSGSLVGVVCVGDTNRSHN